MKEYDWEHRLRVMVHEEMKNYVRGGGSLTKLVKQTGLARSTVSRLVYLETKSPRFSTVILVLRALGFRISVIKGDNPGDNVVPLASVKPAKLAKLTNSDCHSYSGYKD